MDPIAHSLFGAALSRTRMGRDRSGEAVPAAMLALVVGANLPDVDGVTYFLGNDAGLYFRRGLSHGPLGLALLPPLFLALVWLFRRFRGRRTRQGAILPWRRLLLLTYLGALSHPALDWLNTYGVRLLAPFDWRWFYGDTLFIVDPWMWLLLGAATLLGGGAGVRAKRWFLVAALLGSALLLAATPLLGMPVWVAVLFVLASLGIAVVSRRNPQASSRLAGIRFAGVSVANLLVTVFLVYIVAMVVAARAARVEVAEALGERGHRVVDLMVGPRPGTPFEREWVVQTKDSYQVGTFHWLRSPRVSTSQDRFELLDGSRPEVSRALADPCLRGFVHWMRFPTARILRQPDGSSLVQLFDLRYARQPTPGFGGGNSQVPQTEITRTEGTETGSDE